MFDAQAYHRAVSQPSFKDERGRIHVGRVIGTDTFFTVRAKTSVKNPDGSLDFVALNCGLRQMVDLMFPHPWWKVWRHSVRWHVWQLPWLGRMGAIWSFMQSQVKATTGAELGPLPGTTPEIYAALLRAGVPSDVLPIPGSSPSSTSLSPASTTGTA